MIHHFLLNIQTAHVENFFGRIVANCVDYEPEFFGVEKKINEEIWWYGPEVARFRCMDLK